MFSWLTALKNFPCLSPKTTQSFGYPVYLNVYDMFWTNEYTVNIGIGVYHTGIEVHDCEFAYGGHPFPFTGIFSIHPKDAHELGLHFKFKESVFIGNTDFSPNDINDLIELMGQEFTGDKYHLINKNCNHFSNAFAEILCGKPIPGWINRLAYLSSCVPFLEKSLPSDWLTPVALEEVIHMHQDKHHISLPDSSNFTKADLSNTSESIQSHQNNTELKKSNSLHSINSFLSLTTNLPTPISPNLSSRLSQTENRSFSMADSQIANKTSNISALKITKSNSVGIDSFNPENGIINKKLHASSLNKFLSSPKTSSSDFKLSNNINASGSKGANILTTYASIGTKVLPFINQAKESLSHQLDNLIISVGDLVNNNNINNRNHLANGHAIHNSRENNSTIENSTTTFPNPTTSKSHN